jgi:hypothetical protein
MDPTGPFVTTPVRSGVFARRGGLVRVGRGMSTAGANGGAT